MSRRSVQRAVWRSMFKSAEESSSTWLDKAAWGFAVVFVLYMLFGK